MANELIYRDKGSLDYNGQQVRWAGWHKGTRALSDDSHINISWTNNNEFTITDWFKGKTFIFGREDGWFATRKITVKNKSNNYNPEKHYCRHRYRTIDKRGNIEHGKELHFYPIIVENTHEKSPKNQIIDIFANITNEAAKMTYFLPIPGKGRKENNLNKNSNILYKSLYNVNNRQILKNFPNDPDNKWTNYYEWNLCIVEASSIKSDNTLQTNEWNMCPKEGNLCKNINKWTDLKDDYGMGGSKHTLNFKLIYKGNDGVFTNQDVFEIQDKP